MSGDAPSGENSTRREEVEAERVDTWQKTQELRKKLAHVMSTRASTPTEWQKWLDSAQVAHRFVGKAGEAHRVFVLSTDTFGREGDQPWFNVADAGEKELKAVLDFMGTQTSPGDVLLFFDGRSANNRKIIMTHTENTLATSASCGSCMPLGRKQAGGWHGDRKQERWGGSGSPSRAR